MNYNELKNLANQRHIRMKEIAKAVSIGENAFKQSFENGTMYYSKVPIICQLLGITAAQFFDEELIADHKPVSYTQTGKNNTIAAEGSSVVFGSESEVQFLRQQVRQLTEMNRELIKSLKK